MKRMKRMKRIKRILIVLLLVILFPSSNIIASTINGSNWMSAVDGSIPINELTLPGAHDAASYRLNGEGFTNLYGITQDSPISTVSWEWGGKRYTDIGLLEMGTRYFDIRYGLYDNPEKTNDFRNIQQEASSHLLTVHNTFDCEYRYDEGWFGIDLHKKVTNETLMKWVKDFLEKNKKETVIFDIAADDGSDNDEVIEWYSKFYQAQVEHPDDNYPTIYFGDHIPTLDEARGKLVILTSNPNDLYKYAFYNTEKQQKWYFNAPYAVADDKNRTYTFAYRTNDDYEKSDDKRHYSVFKENKYKNLNIFTGSDQKWEYVKNTLDQTNKVIVDEKKNNYNAFMLTYTSANNITSGDAAGTPWEFAEDVNPKVLSYFKSLKPLSGSYGYIAMDWMTPELAKAIYSVNIDQNQYSIANVGLTVSSQNKYTTIIEIAFILSIIIVVTIIVIKKKKTKTKRKKTNKK